MFVTIMMSNKGNQGKWINLKSEFEKAWRTQETLAVSLQGV
jgi:hypothetical protein